MYIHSCYVCNSTSFLGTSRKKLSRGETRTCACFSFWSWRRSSTSTSTCAGRAGSRSPARLTSRNDRWGPFLSSPPGANFYPRGEVVPQGWILGVKLSPGVKFSVRPSILLNSGECSPLGVNGGVNIPPRGQISPMWAWGWSFSPCFSKKCRFLWKIYIFNS
jgi:hypothetical protein